MHGGDKVQVKGVARVIAGTLVLAVGTEIFLIPNDLVAGGVTGIAMALCQLLPGIFLTVEGMVAILGWGLFLLGWICLGNRFASQTLLSTLLYPILLRVLAPLAPSHPGNDVVYLCVAALLGGALVGVGCALTFLGGGSTGGVDVIALVACKYCSDIQRPFAVFAVDALTVLFGYLAFGNVLLSFLGVLSALTGAFIIFLMMRKE